MCLKETASLAIYGKPEAVQISQSIINYLLLALFFYLFQSLIQRRFIEINILDCLIFIFKCPYIAFLVRIVDFLQIVLSGLSLVAFVFPNQISVLNSDFSHCSSKRTSQV